MEWSHLKPADHRRTPWKNGGGMTVELAVEPPGASLETGFAWRVSSAEVAASGPFSAFPGLERWLILLEGGGLEIDFGNHGRVCLAEPLTPIHFPGGWPAVASLLEGPCTDLNVMVDPARCQAQVEVLDVASSRLVPLPAAATLLFVARGTLSIPALDLHLGARHLLTVKGGGRLALAPGIGGAALVQIGFDRI